MAMKDKFKRILDNLNGIKTDYHLTSYQSQLAVINALESEFQQKTDSHLKLIFGSIKEKIASDLSTDADVLVDSFALVHEAAFRTIGMRPFDVQVLGALAMNDGKLAEMQTGEGKTLVAVMPAVLNAMSGNGLHILTFNDYLARRDAIWMGPIYEFLGLSVGFVQEGMSFAQRQKAYQADVTYLTAKEASFDFLRDSLCYDVQNIVHRPFSCAIIDEADSILIDEARIPLVIAGSIEEKIADSYKMADVVRRMEMNVDFDYDEYARNIHLSNRGQRLAEKVLRCGNLYNEENLDLLTRLHNALHSEFLLHKDVDYIVRDGKIELVDEFTGRVADKRRWPDGLQAALEAKENIDVQSKGHILNQIILQHFLRLYPKLCGMTATAQSSAEELKTFYDLDIAVIPPNTPCIRQDRDDRIFATKEAKNAALLEEIVRVAATKRPILVGTSSVEESVQLAADLEQYGVHCHVLNAKNDELEAEIIADAGKLGSVTISTNMAGRGADELQREQVVELGGLYVIGTNKHETERIDRQLRGRAGRQGDPGESRYIVSLRDDLMIKYRLDELLPPDFIDFKDGQPCDHPIVLKETARIQRICDGQNLEIKKTLNQYSFLLEKQRIVLFEKRHDVLFDDAGTEFFSLQAQKQYKKLLSQLGKEKLDRICRMIYLFKIDAAWSDFLAEIADIREGIHLKRIGGQDPFTEFQKLSVKIYDDLLRRLDDDLTEFFQGLTAQNGDLNLEELGIKAPTATWTYLVNDNPFQDQLGLQLIGNMGMQVMGGFMGPILALRLLGRKKKRRQSDWWHS